MSKENLIKSIDEMVDELFAEESVEKSIEIAKDASTTADAVANSAPKSQDDASRNAGRPKQISDVPKKDEDGKREGKYDGDITEREGVEDENEEKDQVKMAGQDKGDQTPDKGQITKSLSEEEYAEFQAYKKAQEQLAKSEELKKAQEEQKDLIKSAVLEATSGLKDENEQLRKSLTETQELVKAMAERPQRRKSIDNIQALEKSQQEEESTSFSKSEMLDAAEELFYKGQLTDTDVTELENTGYIYDPTKRGALESHLKSRK